MTERNDGGPAYPAFNELDYLGMTLRDYFAAQALAGLGLEDGDAYVALRAYQIADAMIAARDKA